MRRNSCLLALIVWFGIEIQTQAAIKYWDANGDTAGAGITTTGTWGVNPYWSTNAEGEVSTSMWAAGDVAVFSAGTDGTDPFTVTVSGNQTVNGLTFQEGAPILSGGSFLPNATPFLISVSNLATISTSFIGTRTLTKAGMGELTLNTTNNFAGAIIVAEGRLRVENGAALGSPDVGTTVSNYASLILPGGVALNEPLLVYGHGLGWGAIHNLAGSNWVGSLQWNTVPGTSGMIYSETGVIKLGKVNAAGNFSLTIQGNGNSIISGDNSADGLFWGGSDGSIFKYGQGTLTIEGPVNIRGTIRAAVGIIRMGGHHRFGNTGNEYPYLEVTSQNGEFDLSIYTNTFSGIFGSGRITGEAGSALVIGLETDTPGASVTFSGVISGGTTLIKEGAKTQHIRNHQTYTGETIINGGILNLSASSLSNSPVIRVAPVAGISMTEFNRTLILNSNQTLMCGGTITGNLFAVMGARISPGLGVGTMTQSSYFSSGELNLSDGATNVWELGGKTEEGAGVNFDQIVVQGAGSVMLGGAATLSIQFTGTATLPHPADPFWQETRNWRIIQATNLTENFTHIENANYAAGAFTTSTDPSGMVLTFTPNAIRPRIAFLSRATNGVTIHYTNTLPGVNYLLFGRTNAESAEWFSLGNKTAFGPMDFQIDPFATNSERFYRVHFVAP